MTITKVTTDVITALAVTAPKLAANAVTTDKLADNAVTAAKIAAGALGDQVAGITSSASATTIAGTLTIPSDIIHSGDTDTILQFNANDSWRVITGDEERFKVNNGEVVVNDNSVDMDFRVESNGNANMLFVDGGNNKIGIATASPISPLHVKEQHAGLSHGYVYADNGISVESDEPMIQLMATDGGTHGGSLLWRYGANVFAAVANPTTDNLDFIYGVTSADDFDVHAGTNMTSHRRSMSIGADGNVGIGAIPKTTEAGWTNLSVGGQGALINSTSANAGGRTQLSNNVYVDESGNYSYISTDQASLYKQIDGIHSWHSAGSGSADAHITMSERMRIHGNGKAAWAANGIGSTATVARDFAFYTEGATNGVEVRSNDQRLVFLGAGGSSGTGVDDGYVAIASGSSTTKIAFNANGASYFNGGNLGIGTASPTIVGSYGSVVDVRGTTTDQNFGGAVRLASNNGSTSASTIHDIVSGLEIKKINNAPVKFFTNNAERMRIDGDGTIQLGNATTGAATNVCVMPTGKLFLDAGGDTFIEEYSANEVGISTGGSRKFALSGGNLFHTGSINSNHSFSDERLKENIVVIPNALEKIQTLRGITFTRKDDGSVGTGLIAQELEKVLPEAVYESKTIESLENPDAEEYKAIRYEKTVGLLVEGIKEQQTIIDDLKARIETLEE